MFALTVADDMTGAAEAAAAIARALGAPARVLLDGSAAGGGEVLVLPLRRRGPARALRVAEGVTLPGEGTVFVKIDSTLRGPWVELVDVLARRLQAEPLICPAFPARGRTVEGGVPLVDGGVLWTSAFRAEIIGGGEVATLAELVRARAPSLRADLPDARSDADLDAMAQRARSEGRRLVVGSAGLVQAFARRSLARGQRARDPLADAPAARAPVVIAAGSRSQVTERQVARAAGRAAVVRDDGLGAIARRAVQAAGGGTIVCCGGEMTHRVLEALGARETLVYGERAPAIMQARPEGSALTLLTKSGSLGPDDAIVMALEALGL